MNLDKLPYGDAERIEKRSRLGAEGFELAARLAEWVVACRPYREDIYIGVDDGELRDAIESYLGLELIHKTEILVNEINQMLELRIEDEARYAEWVARRADVFGDHPSIPEV